MNIEALDQKTWGICGFVAAFQAANINQKPTAALLADTYATLMPVIDKFVAAHPELAAELLDFSASFGAGYTYKTVKEITDKMHTDKTMTGADIGLAMTASGVSKLCKDLGFANYNFIGTTSANNTLDLDKLPYKNTIYGIGITGAPGRPRNFRSGLLHWIYVDPQGNVLTWAKKGAAAVQDLKGNGYNKITHYLTLS